MNQSSIAQAFVSSDTPLLEILKSDIEPSGPVQKALQHLQECLAGQRLAREALASARSAELEKTEPDLLVLMLGSWAELAGRIGQSSEAVALIHRAQSAISSDSPPEIVAFLSETRATLAGLRGQQRRKDQLLTEALEMVPRTAPRHNHFLVSKALAAAQAGTLDDVDMSPLTAENERSYRFAERISLIRFINSVETGNISLAESHRVGIPTNAAMFRTQPSLARLFRQYSTALELIQMESGNVLSMLEDPHDMPSHLLWTVVIRCLLDNLTEDALYWARLAERKNQDTVTACGIMSFTLIRAELCAGNGDAARRLLHMRHSRGNRHYLDSYYMARVEQLSGETELATNYFADALSAAQRYRAQQRFDFELNLSRELKPGLLMSLTRQSEQLMASQAKAPVVSIEEPPPAPPEAVGLKRLIGVSDGIQNVRDTIRRFASLEIPVFITGDTGTGKELVAHALHEESKREKHRFIPINCGAIVDTLLESELFGHKKGAFTGAASEHAGFFEEAGEGCVFLDEIGDISPRLQVALLRVLESGEIRPIGNPKSRRVKCRILAATNAPLEHKVAMGDFRSDLLFRLRRLEIVIPPLRERRDDIIPLVMHFLDIGRRPDARVELSTELVNAFMNYDWPGNVRELRNVIEQMRLLHSDKLQYALRDMDQKFQGVVTLRPKEIVSAPSENTALRQDAEDSALNSPTRKRTRPPQDAADSARARSVISRGRSPLRRLERLRRLFEEHPVLTRREIIEIMDISPNTATSDLKRLCESKEIRKVCPTASARSHYFERVPKNDE